MPILSDFAWKLFYTPEDGDLVERLYVPLLSCAERYDRLTGYFTATALALAARGLEGLVLNNGSMRLIVGCTLGPAEVAAIERGEALRNSIERVLAAMPLAPNGDIEHQGLELLAWLVAQGRLEVKVAVPCDEHRRPLASEAIFHEKIGIVEDKTGQKAAFIGSLNETESGWRANSESLSLFTSWREPERVADKEAHFARLWADKAKRALVVDVPRAVREDLLRFLPEGDRLPQRLAAHGARLQPSVAVAAPRPAAPPRPEPLSREELRARVWRGDRCRGQPPARGRARGGVDERGHAVAAPEPRLPDGCGATGRRSC
ncbi:MAG: phospholipase D-like domain-containing protein [Acetobacteraceae bacterium]|nr:phospholipase D-like domain-containing protein [Acetobacteraceae bacterium]